MLFSGTTSAFQYHCSLKPPDCPYHGPLFDHISLIVSKEKSATRTLRWNLQFETLSVLNYQVSDADTTQCRYRFEFPVKILGDIG
jgi:hypothetical protein